MIFKKLYDDLYLKRHVKSATVEAKSRGWNIHLQGECVDFVWFDVEYSQREAWELLIYKYGYPVDIKIYRPS